MTPYSPEVLGDVWERLRRPRGRERETAVGVDGTGAATFERNLAGNIREISRLASRLDTNGTSGYRFAALLRMEKPKPGGGTRLIYVPRLRDQILLRAMHQDVVAAARRRGIQPLSRPPLHLLRDFRTSLTPGAFVLRTDVRDFFASVPRDKAVFAAAIGVAPITRRLLRKWSDTVTARAPWTAGKDGDVPVSGLPPGVSLSSCLSEIWMSALDTEARVRFRFFRHVDDIAVVCDTEREALEARGWLGPRIQALGLDLSPAKTAIHRLRDGIPWLGLIHYEDRVALEPGRIEKWLRRLAAMRRRAGDELARPDAHYPSILAAFHRTVRDEISGRSSSRPTWYAETIDDGSWRRFDRSLHAIIRSLHRQAGVAPPTGRQLPSLHRAILGRVRDHKHSAPSPADEGHRAPIPVTGEPHADQGRTACDGAESSS